MSVKEFLAKLTIESDIRKDLAIAKHEVHGAIRQNKREYSSRSV